MNPGGPSSDSISSGVSGAKVGAEGVPQLDLVEAVVAADQRQDEAAVLDHHGNRLQRGPAGDAEGIGDLLDGGQPGRRHLARLVQGRRQLDGLRLGGGHLDVRRVPGRDRHLVLPRLARRQVLVGPRAAHHADVGLDAVPAQAAAVEDPVVGLDVELVAAVEPLGVAVEAVGVLHRELARAQHAGARPRLVALLGLHVVQDHRQLPVGADLAGDVEGEVLLVGHRQRQLGLLAVLELEQLVDLVAAGPPPELRRLEHRHQHLLAADRVDLLADDLLDPLHHPVAGRQERPQPGAELADQAGPDHQPVGERLGVGGVLAKGGQEVAGEPAHGRRA